MMRSRHERKPYEPDDAYDRPGPVPLSNYAAGPRLAPRGCPSPCARRAGRPRGTRRRRRRRRAGGTGTGTGANPRASREEPFNPARRAVAARLARPRRRAADAAPARRRRRARGGLFEDQARRDRQVKLDAEAEARTLNGGAGPARDFRSQLRDDAVEAAAARGRDAVAVEALQGRVAALENSTARRR